VRQIPLAVELRDSATFATYSAGSNALAVAFLQTLAAGRGRGCWIWGAAGSGKSHLLQASCATATENCRLAAYLPMTQLAPMGPEALSGWSGQDLVAVDELDVIVGDRRLETPLFTLYNELADRGGTLLVASETPPASLAFTLPDLRSRLAAGAVFQLTAPDEHGAVDALQLRARHRGLDLPEDTARYLLRRVPRDMASLCEWLDRLDLASLAAQRRLTVPFVRQVLAADKGPGSAD